MEPKPAPGFRERLSIKEGMAKCMLDFMGKPKKAAAGRVAVRSGRRIGLSRRETPEVGLMEREGLRGIFSSVGERSRVGERGGEEEIGMGGRRKFSCTFRRSCSRMAS